MIFALTYWYVDILFLEIYFPHTDLETKPASLSRQLTGINQVKLKSCQCCAPLPWISLPTVLSNFAELAGGKRMREVMERGKDQPICPCLFGVKKKKKWHWSLILDKTEPFSSKSELSWSAKIWFFPWKLRCCHSLKNQEPTEWTKRN